jgi:hypothetical protein
MARIEVDSGNAFSQLPWIGASLDLGASLTLHDRWGLAVQGSGTANGNLFYADSIVDAIYHLLWRTEARLWWQTPYWGARASWLRVGCGFGYSLVGPGDLDKEKEDFTLHVVSHEHNAPYLAPEVGLTNEEGRDRMELGVRYLWHIDRSPAVTTVLSVPEGTTTATATHDQLMLVVRYSFGLPRRPSPASPPLDIDPTGRTTDTLTTLFAQREVVTLVLRDNAEYDGDTVVVVLNGVPAIEPLELTNKPQKVRLRLLPGRNDLTIVALNEGRVPPNTASARMRGVRGDPELLIQTSERRNQLVTIMRR